MRGRWGHGGRCGHLKREAKSSFIFVLEKGAHSLAPGHCRRSNPVGCWHFAVALVGLNRPRPHVGQAGVVRVGKCKSQSSETRSICHDVLGLDYLDGMKNARQMVTRWALRTFEARGQVVLHFCFRKRGALTCAGHTCRPEQSCRLLAFCRRACRAESTPPPCWPGGGGLA